MAFTEIASGLQFPEGPIALADGSLLLVEIQRGTLSRITTGGVVEVVAELGGGPNGAAIGPDGAVYVCNNGGFDWIDVDGTPFPVGRAANYRGGSIQRVDLQSGAVTTLYTHCNGHPLSGPNDIVFDRQGGFWFTDLGQRYGRQQDRGAIYYALPDGSEIVEAAFPVDTPNGIGLSPDEQTLYVADTTAARLWAFDIVAPGELAPPAGFHNGHCLASPQGLQHYDSLAVDGEGNICVATILNGGITWFAADGRVLDHFPTGDIATTNICFGGPGLKTAYITLSASGRVVSMPWPVAGLPLNFLNR
ncbi:SMP-30/gluconolactonase/LRE family protein [Parahaliea mediterranea]|uniref:SMP-30/gluconolactonase/LRE family protein n=1 Tax=Parahaliea mediterranea TaxID=651086 RepID=UPI000E2FAA5E|nr:SMP-30/gluconolactonase/LRE family protein [Parahaliea mediterranea]